MREQMRRAQQAGIKSPQPVVWASQQNTRLSAELNRVSIRFSSHLLSALQAGSNRRHCSLLGLRTKIQEDFAEISLSQTMRPTQNLTSSLRSEDTHRPALVSRTSRYDEMRRTCLPESCTNQLFVFYTYVGLASVHQLAAPFCPSGGQGSVGHSE